MTRIPCTVFVLLVAAPSLRAEPDLSAIDTAVTAAIDRGEVPGAVVVVVHRDRVVYRKAFGDRTIRPDREPMTVDTVFDLASLTKPVATATAVHILAERGRLSLADPVAKHWPAFAANGKDAISLEQCLLHTAGLTADNAIADYADGREKALERIAALKLETPAGTRFRYSDVGYIVLGEVVGRVAGKPLDEFTAESVFTPLKMTDTCFRPAKSVTPRVASTGVRDGKSIRGEVHDPRAFQLGGVAGHAGLFGSADDLARFARMLLHSGDRSGVRVLKNETVATFIEPRAVPASTRRKLLRSLGWDVDTGYSGQRGTTFPAGRGYGHTGFTGTSLWIDPPTQTAIIVLTSRLHPNEKGSVTRLRSEIGTIVGSVVQPVESQDGK